MKPILAEGYAYGLLRRDVSALKEQVALERRWRKEREARICRVAREHPDLGIDMIAERFNGTEAVIKKVLARHGIKREDDLLASWHYGRVKLSTG